MRKLTKAQKAKLYDYLRYIENAGKSAEIKKSDYLVVASDGTTFWGKTYDEAIEKAMVHEGWGRLPVYGIEKRGAK